MAIFTEQAPAKVNLTLRILGRRPDGYHELESLVGFAGIGDLVTLDPGLPADLEVTGPFADGIDGPNLVGRALQLVKAAHPRMQLGRVMLDKRLPVAAGLGGGSADAAALLRGLRRANPDAEQPIDWPGLALRLGADVPVCLAGRPALMRGIGERVTPCDLPVFAAVLVNAMAAVPADKTGRVFQALAAGPFAATRQETVVFRPDSLAGLVALMRAHGNDLERPAIAVMPTISEVKAALVASAGCVHAQLSGAGPTCFGVFTSAVEARRASVTIAGAAPSWWVRETTIGGQI